LNLLENVFADQTATINASASEEVVLKPKRSAFVFITVDSESSQIAFEDLRKMAEVQEVYLARGAYDLVAKVSGDSLEHLREDVLRRIRGLSSVKSTLTLAII
jgi:DNA-binding Lrp family transcriptional regulator